MHGYNTRQRNCIHNKSYRTDKLWFFLTDEVGLCREGKRKRERARRASRSSESAYWRGSASVKPHKVSKGLRPMVSNANLGKECVGVGKTWMSHFHRRH